MPQTAARAGRAGDPHLRIVDCRWVLGRARSRRDGLSRRATCRARSISTSTRTSPIATATARRVAIRSPPRPTSPRPSAAAGIGDDDLVVAYDDVGGWVAARLWWMLDVLGHHDVLVLDGGIAAWVAAGGELTTALPRRRRPSSTSPSAGRA